MSDQTSEEVQIPKFALQLSPFREDESSEWYQLRNAAYALLEEPKAETRALESLKPIFAESAEVITRLVKKYSLRFSSADPDPIFSCFGLYKSKFEPSHQIRLEGEQSQLSSVHRLMIDYGLHFGQANVHLFFEKKSGLSDLYSSSQQSFVLNFVGERYGVRGIMQMALDRKFGHLTSAYAGHQILVYTIGKESLDTELQRINAFINDVRTKYQGATVRRKDIWLTNFGNPEVGKAIPYEEASRRLAQDSSDPR